MKIIYSSIMQRIHHVVFEADVNDRHIERIELSKLEYAQLCDEILRTGPPEWYSDARRYKKTMYAGVQVVQV